MYDVYVSFKDNHLRTVDIKFTQDPDLENPRANVDIYMASNLWLVFNKFVNMYHTPENLVVLRNHIIERITAYAISKGFDDYKAYIEDVHKTQSVNK